jgi:predicted DCC family thiol-disulfide oxidoreductase YuxK
MLKLIVWYNTKCPVCDAGIDWQKSRLVRARFGASVNDVRRRLHATDEDDRLFVGMDCAIEIWRRTPGDGWLARLFGAPVVRGIARVGYDRFADLLYFWNRRRKRW